MFVGKDSGQVVQAWRPLLRTSHFKIAGINFSAGALFAKFAGTNLIVTTFSGFLGFSAFARFCDSSSSRNKLGSTPTSIWVTQSSSIRRSLVPLGLAMTVVDSTGLLVALLTGTCGNTAGLIVTALAPKFIPPAPLPPLNLRNASCPIYDFNNEMRSLSFSRLWLDKTSLNVVFFNL